MSCDSGSVASWASGIGIDPCIGQAYCNANGSLPQSLDALNTWGLATGYKSSAGKWNCTPSPNPGTGQPPVTGGATPTSARRINVEYHDMDSGESHPVSRRARRRRAAAEEITEDNHGRSL